MINRRFFVRRSGDCVVSCAACGAKNYDVQTFEDVDCPLFWFRIGNYAQYICPSCLRALIGEATVELIKMDIEDK